MTLPGTGRLQRIWAAATEPHPKVTGLARRRRVRVAAGLDIVLFLVVAVFVGYSQWRTTTPAGAYTARYLLPLALVLIAVAYLVLRSPWPRVGKWLLVLVPWATVGLSWWRTLPAADEQHLYFLSIPIILAGLVLPIRAAGTFGALNILAVVALLLSPRTTPMHLADVLVTDAALFLLAVTALTLAGSGLVQRSLRAQEQANDEMRRLEAERTQLLNIIAHDLAAPLSPILVRLDLLRRVTDDEKHLPVIQRNVDHLQRLITDLRDLARIHAGRLSVERRPLALDALVQQSTEAVVGTQPERQVKAAVVVEDRLPVLADPDRMNQVLYNLLRNAFKFSPREGSVSVRAWRQDGVARVAVQDEGRGLAPEEIGRLFQPFSQVHKPGEVKEKGTGLGLFISKGIVEAHGGRIWAESDGLGKGATFTFELPVAHQGG